MRLTLIATLVLAFAPFAGHAQTAYRTPPPELKAIADAPRAPELSLSPGRDLLALIAQPGLPGIDVVAQEELKLGGTRIHPKSFSSSQFVFGDDLRLLEIASGRELRIDGLPSPLSIASSAWSPDQRYLAFNQVEPAKGVNALWLVDVGQRKARRLTTRGLNTVTDRGYQWMPDSRGLLVSLQPTDGGALPSSDGVPAGPNIQQAAGGGQVRSLRTFQDLLGSPLDARRFEHLVRNQPALVGVDGRVTTLGAADTYTRFSVSPDGRMLLSERITTPYSYLVPYRMFPRVIEVRDLRGQLVHTVATLPAVEGLPTGNDAVAEGVRSVSWRNDAPAALVWAEAADGGDPARAAEVRDIVYMQAAPFNAEPQVLARLGSRYRGIQWGRGDVAILNEFWWRDRHQKQWLIQPDNPQAAARLLHEGSSQDRYNDPGMPVMVPDANGNAVLLTSSDGGSIYRIGAGASEEGDRPFLDRQSLASLDTTRLFHSAAPVYEMPVALLDADGARILTMRESPKSPPNVHLRATAGDGKLTALTRFPHPTPQLADVQKEQIRYKRADGVDLTGTLYLPPGHDPRRDGPLPLLMWAYPREFRSADDASQVTGSPYRFNAISHWGPLAYLATGWAVLDNPTMPIIGEGDAEPNDTYVKQLAAGAQAAVDEVVRRGVADRHRIAVGGHSYGAFMTANLLAHTDLFRAGIARSGAYNRTLTPFGFQAEERNFWQAADTYSAMSPFNHAEKIKAPILLIHGEQDNNSGTFPVQSERMYAAVAGLGGTVRLVMLPNESHGYRARESIYHMLAETHDWLQQHVQPRQGAASAAE
ncbi:MAG: alpha/beta fold hydrolase [Pseudoxanthomonas suwonensis]|nr:alpha/beta fold hydrolase [Pseudoxanthomonas suwonensis]